MQEGVNMQVTIKLENIPYDLRIQIVECMHDADELTRLSRIDDLGMVEAVAGNSNTPEGVLKVLASNGCDDVQ